MAIDPDLLGDLYSADKGYYGKPNSSFPHLNGIKDGIMRKDLINAKTKKQIKTKHKFNYDLMKNGKWPEDFIKKDGLQMRSVWSIYPPKNGEKKFGKHPTQKPIDLLVRIILASTDKGDIIIELEK